MTTTPEAVAALVQEWRERAARLETTWTATLGPAAIDFVLEDGGVTCAYVRPDADSDEAIAGVTETDGHLGDDRDAVLVAGIERWLSHPEDAELLQLPPSPGALVTTIWTDVVTIVREWRTLQAEGEKTWRVPIHGSDLALSTLLDGSTLAELYADGERYANIRDQDLAQHLDANEGDGFDAAFAYDITTRLTTSSARGEAPTADIQE